VAKKDISISQGPWCGIFPFPKETWFWVIPMARDKNLEALLNISPN
jgi:hypothetical protein